ncbi:Cas10/Cmr2 second palm domain-containing protein [Hydrogenobaculum acidophilum]
MDDKRVAVIIDVPSIQRYIFGSNRLKHNIGASYIVKRLYDEPMKEALIGIKEGEDFKIGYKGGGNALLLFKHPEKAKEFIKKYSKVVMEYFPGVSLAFGMIEDFDEENTQDSLRRLHYNLKENKSKYLPIVNINKWGITKDCPESYESAEVYNPDDKNFISRVVEAKLEAFEIGKDDFDSYLKEYKDYTFPSELSKCTLEENDDETENPYIALVHIDGNKMGERFRACKSIDELKKLSESVENVTKESFKAMLNRVIDLHKKDQISLREEDGKYLMPLRPIILGGDDITFVCDAKLGIELAKYFIDTFSKGKVSDGKPLNACGGIFIVKAKYPFFKSYTVAEELTSEAKKASREKEGSYISFAIAKSGFTGDWKNFSKIHYKAIEGNVRFSPYDVKTLNELFKVIYHFKEKWPKNKVYELRELLFDKKEKVKMFLYEVKEKYKLELEEYEDYKEHIWKNSKTPYFDAIELMEFVP